MSRMQLNQIQSELKTAIQNHQVLVSRIQLHPKDMAIRGQLYKLQKEIMAMSQKQKIIVEKLRKEIVERNPSDSQEVQLQNLTNETKPKGPPEKQLCRSDYQVTAPSHTIPKGSCNTSQSNTGLTVITSLKTHDDSLSQNSSSHSTTPAISSSSSPLRIPAYPSHKTHQAEKVDDPQSVQSTPTCQTINKTTQQNPKQKSIPVDPVQSEVTDKDKQMKKKLRFMASIDLVPPDTIKEQTGKRSERKRRSTNNPNFAYGFELERRPRTFLASDYFGAKKSKARPKTPQCSPPLPAVSHNDTPNNCKENTLDESLCRQCGNDGELLHCEVCAAGFHARCVHPPVSSSPGATWTCTMCQEQSDKSTMSLAAVNAYIANKTGKEEEKRKLLKKSSELLQEKTHLQNRAKQLNEILVQQGIRRQELLHINQKAKESEEKLKSFLKVVQSS